MTQQQLQRKMSQMDSDYRQMKQQVAENHHWLAQNKQVFVHYLEHTTEKLQRIKAQQPTEYSADLTKAYQFLEQSQEEIDQFLKKGAFLLDEELDKAQKNYRKQIDNYEEKLQQLKKEAMENV